MDVAAGSGGGKCATTGIEYRGRPSIRCGSRHPGGSGARFPCYPQALRLRRRGPAPPGAMDHKHLVGPAQIRVSSVCGSQVRKHIASASTKTDEQLTARRHDAQEALNGSRPPRQTGARCGPVALVSTVAARVHASMAGEDGEAQRAPGAWCASARAGGTTLDSGHGHEARLLRRSQQKLDSRLTGLCTDAADLIAATNTEVVPPARASSVPAPVRQATVYRRLAARLNSSVATVRICLRWPAPGRARVSEAPDSKVIHPLPDRRPINPDRPDWWQSLSLCGHLQSMFSV